MNNPIFGTSGISSKNKDKSKICTYLKDIGLNALEVPYKDLSKLSKRDCLNILQDKEDTGIIISTEFITRYNINNIDKVINKYKKFLNKSISIGSRHILIPLEGIDNNTNIDLVIDLFNRMRSITSNDIKIYPEISGVSTSIGSLEDIIYICSKVDNIYPCLDLGKLHGREYGSLVNYRKINSVFNKIESMLGRDYLNNSYIRIYPVSYNLKGAKERKNFGEQFYGQMNLFNQSTEYLPKASEFINSIIKKDIYPITISITDKTEELGALQLRDIYFYKKNERTK